MTDRTWHKGPPPHPGWWVASFSKDRICWRWWNGAKWSFPAYRSFTAQEAAIKAIRCEYGTKDIEWTHYYPKDARVPRIDPRKFQQSKE